MTEPLGTLVVTGGGRGIGAAIVRLAAARGYPVAVNYQSDAAAANGLVQEILQKGGSAAAIQADVPRKPRCCVCSKQWTKRFPGLLDW